MGTPTVTVSYTGDTDSKILNFKFENLKGDSGTSVSVSTVTSSSADDGNNIVTFTDGKKLYVKNGSKGSTGAGISAIKQKGNTQNLVDTYEITYTDGRAATHFTVTNGAPGTSVTITSVSPNTTSGSYSTVSFSTGDTLKIYNGSKGSDGYSTYYTSESYATQGLKKISLSTVTKLSDRTIQAGDFILAPNGNIFIVNGVNNTEASIDYLTSIKGVQGPKGDDGTSVNIKDTLSDTDALEEKQNGAVNGDGYIIGEDLYVYTGGSGEDIIFGFKSVGKIKGPQGETGPQGPAGTSVTIKSLVSSSAPGGASTITFSDNTTLKVYNGDIGPAGVGISEISRNGETVVVTYTDPNKQADSFTVKDGDDGDNGYSIFYANIEHYSDNGNNLLIDVIVNPDEKDFQKGDLIITQSGYVLQIEGNIFTDETGATYVPITELYSIKGPKGDSVKIEHIDQNNEEGGTSTVTFSDGNVLKIKNGSNASGGSGSGSSSELDDIISSNNDTELIVIDIYKNVGLRLDSEGLFVQDVIAGENVLSNKIDKAINIIYSDLVSLKDDSTLVPGQYYRIIDYITTTTQEDTNYAYHQFDVIVLALSDNTLAEEAYAIQSERDTNGYFINSNLSAWKIWYCLDNDTNRFAWADENNGTGVIYRMIDEFGNDCPYDFKNIRFKRKLKDGKLDETSGADTWCFTFGGDVDYSLTVNNRNNVIKQFYDSDTNNIKLNNNVFISENCYNNTFANNCSNNTFGNYCNNNTFANNCSNNTFGNYCNNNTFANNCSNNTFGDNSHHNTFGYLCHSNTFVGFCQYNTFGNYCNNNKLGIYCFYNTFGNYCVHIIFGSSETDLRGYYNNIIIDNGNRNIYLNCTSSTSGVAYFQNVRIGLGFNNTSNNKTINDNNVNQSYETYYGNMRIVGDVTSDRFYQSDIS